MPGKLYRRIQGFLVDLITGGRIAYVIHQFAEQLITVQDIRVVLQHFQKGTSEHGVSILAYIQYRLQAAGGEHRTGAGVIHYCHPFVPGFTRGLGRNTCHGRPS